MPKRMLLIATVNGPREVEGTVMRLKVGAQMVRFFVHEWQCQTVLTHYASGRRVGQLGPIKLAHAVRWGTGGQMNDRAAAEALIAQAVEKNGVDRVMAVFSDAPVINPT